MSDATALSARLAGIDRYEINGHGLIRMAPMYVLGLALPVKRPSHGLLGFG